MDYRIKLSLKGFPLWSWITDMTSNKDYDYKGTFYLGPKLQKPAILLDQIHSNFGINCGGPQITSSSQIVHEQDNKPLGPSTYYLNPERSNVGRRDILRNNTKSTKRKFNNTLASTSCQFTNAIDSQLFQTARISAGSLRYNGILNDGRVIAVKQLAIASHQGKSQFVAEIATISDVQHRNLVKLYGCCIDGEKRVLVYENLENKSLDQALFGCKKLSLTWSTRFEICMGIARGLSYLHEESRIRIIHRDVKSSNVLLDSNMKPKISGFGLAKLYDDKKSHLSTRVAGTLGYLAPEYAMWGHLTEKADVFGFGVVALEIISGRPNSDSSLKDEKIFLLNWVCFIFFFMYATVTLQKSVFLLQGPKMQQQIHLSGSRDQNCKDLNTSKC
ncbi:hypothetical protein LXL04_039507 [Taraxacum kok-saghyz]